MFKLKRTISAVLSFLMVLQMCSAWAFAAETVKCTFTEEMVCDEILEDGYFYELPNKYTNIVSVEKRELDGEELLGRVSAYSDENVPLEVRATLNKIVYEDPDTNKSVCNNRGSRFKTIYALRGTTKTSNGSYSSDGVTLTGTIRWVDNFGLFNEFLSAAGARSGYYTGNGYYSVTNSSTGLGSGTFDTTFYTTGNSNSHVGTTFHFIIHTRATNGRNVSLSMINSAFD